MKKFIFSAVAGVILLSAVFAGYKVHQSKNMSAQEILTMKNIEALTQYEITIIGYCTGTPEWMDCVYGEYGAPIGRGRFVEL